MADKEITWEKFDELRNKDPRTLTDEEYSMLNIGLQKWHKDPTWEFREKYKSVEGLVFDLNEDGSSISVRFDKK